MLDRDIAVARLTQQIQAEVPSDLIALIPVRVREALIRFVVTGSTPGHFCTAVLDNDLRAATAHADDQCLPVLKHIMDFVFNYFPTQCWGSPAARKAWTQKGGKVGPAPTFCTRDSLGVEGANDGR